MARRKDEQKKDRVKPQDKNSGYIRYVRDVPDEKDCPDCNGTGRDPWDGGQCDRGGGTGTVPSKKSFW